MRSSAELRQHRHWQSQWDTISSGAGSRSPREFRQQRLRQLAEDFVKQQNQFLLED